MRVEPRREACGCRKASEMPAFIRSFEYVATMQRYAVRLLSNHSHDIGKAHSGKTSSTYLFFENMKIARIVFDRRGQVPTKYCHISKSSSFDVDEFFEIWLDQLCGDLSAAAKSVDPCPFG